MEKVVSLNSYKDNKKKVKEAEAVLPHLEAILKVFKLSVAALDRFKAYIPVAKVLNVVEEQKLILESHLVKYNKILESSKNDGKN